MSVVANSPGISPDAGVLSSPVTIGLELSRLKAAFLAAIDSPTTVLHAVLGNESADLDSICTAVGKALFLSAQNRGRDTAVVPVLNLPRADLALRRDVLRVLEVSDIAPTDLLCIDEVKKLGALAASGRLKVHLVDHNELAIGQEHLAGAVVEVLDHHSASGGAFPQLSPERRTIERCASCATLLTHQILGVDSRFLSPSIATLLLATITVDSQNFSERGPAKRFDAVAAEELYPRVSSRFTYDLYSELMALREDITGFSLSQLLVRDLKRYQHGETRYAISSLPQSAQWRVADDTRFEPELSALCRVRDLKLVMGLLWGGEVPADKRTFKIYSPDSGRSEQLAEQLMRHSVLGQALSYGTQGATSIVTLHCTEALTRKALQPLLVDLDFGT